MYVLLIARGYLTNRYKLNGIFEFDQAKALVASGCKVVYAIDVRSIRRWRKWGIEHKKIDERRCYNLPGGRLPRKIIEGMQTIGLSVLYKNY